MNASPDEIIKIPRSLRMNLWLSSRPWIAALAVIVAMLAFGFAVVVLTSRVSNNARALRESQYNSCIADATTDFQVAQGQVVLDAFNRDQAATARDIPTYRTSLDQLGRTKVACRVKFPAP